MVSALTLLGLDEMMARYASYETLAEIIRRRFRSPRVTLHGFYEGLYSMSCAATPTITPATIPLSGTEKI
ncbi:MAG: hypothetical protein OXC91_01755 [Rhodobacteraceae bacterium]|nr:hypothetical protein [Paracoccaceae bacterium]